MRGDSGEDVVLVAKVAEIERGGLQERVEATRVPLVRRKHGDEAGRLLDRQRIQQHGVDQRKDGGVRADAERERQSGNCREPRRLREQADAELQIV